MKEAPDSRGVTGLPVGTAPPRRRRRNRWAFLTVAGLFLLPLVAHAVSLYDIIRMSKAGYTDEEIVGLIDVTESRFVLEPDILVQLKKEGVSEGVIAALIQAREPDHVRSRESRPTEATSGEAEYAAVPEDESPSVVFASSSFQEPGHGSAHQHYALTIKEIPILILRSEAGFSRIAERAENVADLLNQHVRSADGGFFATSGAKPSVWYRDPSAPAPVRMLELDRGDVIAYQRRSIGSISGDRLAAYWAALLHDYTRLFLFGRPASQLAKLHLGETLSRIHEQVKSIEDEPGDPSSAEPGRLLGLLDHLSPEDKDHLIELSTRVPVEFRGAEPTEASHEVH